VLPLVVIANADERPPTGWSMSCTSSTVDGARSTDEAGKDSWHGLKRGSEVVAHDTRRGTEDAAVEIDKVGKDGLKRREGNDQRS
jgi:hypothetical protein